MNSIDDRTNQIVEEIRGNYANEVDQSIRADLEFHAACFRCAVLESKLRIEQDLNREHNIRWK